MKITSPTYDLTKAFHFLKKIKKNNNREWFAKNKPLYEAAHLETIQFADALLNSMQQHDTIETPSGKKSVYRIYNDVRFSKDKSPYKNNFSGGFRRATKALRGGYYFQLEPGNSFIAAGFWGPNAEDLLHIRKHIASDPSGLEAVFRNKKLVQTFGSLQGEQVKTAPRGFDINQPGIEYIRHKQFLLMCTFSDEEVLQPNFHATVSKSFQALRPFLDCMSEILTTDLNGISLLEK